jgi:hypothetical protein
MIIFNLRNSIRDFHKKIDDFDHWVLAEILDNKGTIKIVMVQKSANPL